MSQKYNVDDSAMYDGERVLVMEIVESGWGTKQVLRVLLPSGDTENVLNTDLEPDT